MSRPICPRPFSPDPRRRGCPSPVPRHKQRSRAGPRLLFSSSHELTPICHDVDGQQPQYPQQAYYSGPPGGGDKGPQMYQNSAPGMQQGYYPPPPPQGQYQGQQVRHYRTLMRGIDLDGRADDSRSCPLPPSPPLSFLARATPLSLCRHLPTYSQSHLAWHMHSTLLPIESNSANEEQPMYYGQQPMNQPNVVVQQQPRDSGPGCCACLLGCCAAMLWCV